MPESNILTVGQVNRYLKARLESDRVLSFVAVKGELSNYKCYPSGHHYFTLKDNEGVLSCVLFRSAAVRLRFTPEDGLSVVVRGRITLFPRDGRVQLQAEAIIPEGLGELALAFEQLKCRLNEQGLFDPAHKKPLPPFPERVVIITSPAGDAVHDMLRILKARWPLAEVRLMPVRVQGTQAPAEMAGALRFANRHQLGDVILLGRGGGSAEELWAFNDERLAHAIYESEIPVISGVGHEPDVTISDFVADVRAATPTNAAQLAVPDRREQGEKLAHLWARMLTCANGELDRERKRLNRLAGSTALTDPRSVIRDRRVLLDYLYSRMDSAMGRSVAAQRERLAAACGGLDAMSPLKVLSRGYAAARDESGRMITSIEQTAVGEKLSLRLKDGSVDCAVTDIRKDVDGNGREKGEV